MVIMVVERILGIKKNSNVGFKSINIYFFINIKYQTNPGATPKGNEKIFSEENLTCSTRLQLYKGSSLFYFVVAFYEQPCSKAGEIRFVVSDMCLCLCLCERDWGREGGRRTWTVNRPYVGEIILLFSLYRHRLDILASPQKYLPRSPNGCLGFPSEQSLKITVSLFLSGPVCREGPRHNDSVTFNPHKRVLSLD